MSGVSRAVAFARRDRDQQSRSNLASLRKLISAPRTSSTGSSAPPVSMASAMDIVTVYALPPSRTKLQLEAFLWQLVFRMRDPGTESIAYWVSCLATLVYTLYGGLFSSEVLSTLSLNVLKQSEIEACEDFMVYMKQCAIDSLSPDDNRVDELDEKMNLSMLPALGDIAPLLVKAGREMATYYAYLGVLMFAIVKDVSATGKEALMVSRSSAVTKKYKWTEESAPFLFQGALPLIHGFTKISSAWLRLPAVKYVLFKYVARLSDTIVSTEDEAMFTTARLMQFADLAHVMIIGQFIKMYPWVVSLDELSSDLANYKEGWDSLVAACPDITSYKSSKSGKKVAYIHKDISVIPYLKMIYGDKKDLAKREGMKVLLYVAYQALKEDIPTLSSYKVEYEAKTAYNKFLDVRRKLSEEDDDSDESVSSSDSDTERPDAQEFQTAEDASEL